VLNVAASGVVQTLFNKLDDGSSGAAVFKGAVTMPSAVINNSTVQSFAPSGTICTLPATSGTLQLARSILLASCAYNPANQASNSTTPILSNTAGASITLNGSLIVLGPGTWSVNLSVSGPTPGGTAAVLTFSSGSAGTSFTQYGGASANEYNGQIGTATMTVNSQSVLVIASGNPAFQVSSTGFSSWSGTTESSSMRK